jgi:hypothetical protein
LAKVTAENEKAEVEKAFGKLEVNIQVLFVLNTFYFLVSEEEFKVAEIKENVLINQKKSDQDLEKAEPAVRSAEEALNTLNKVITVHNVFTRIQHQKKILFLIINSFSFIYFKNFTSNLNIKLNTVIV